MIEKEHLTKKWEISIIEFQNTIGKKYKVTRRLPDLAISETKMFRKKWMARKQFNVWLGW